MRVVAALYALEVRHARLASRIEKEVAEMGIAVDKAGRGGVVQFAQPRDRRSHDTCLLELARDRAAMRRACYAREHVEHKRLQRVFLAKAASAMPPARVEKVAIVPIECVKLGKLFQ